MVPVSIQEEFCGTIRLIGLLQPALTVYNLIKHDLLLLGNTRGGSSLHFLNRKVYDANRVLDAYKR